MNCPVASKYLSLHCGLEFLFGELYCAVLFMVVSGATQLKSASNADEKLQNEMWGLLFLLQSSDCKLELLLIFN